MKRVLSVILITMTILTGCETKEKGDPKLVADQFIDAASRNDMPAMKNLSTVESRFVLDRIGNSVSQAGGVMSTTFNKQNVETGEATISGDEAIVPVIDKKSKESINLTLKKQLGEWKVSLDMNTIMDMVNSKMREKGVVINDTLRKILPSLDDINIDSLSRNIRINGKSVDSFKNAFKKRGISLDSLKKRKIDIKF